MTMRPSRCACQYMYYSGPCILRPSIQPEKYSLKLKVVTALKWRDNYIEYRRLVPFLASLKIEEIVKHVKQRGLKLQGQLYRHGHCQ